MQSTVAWILLSCCAVLNASAQADVESAARSKVASLEQLWARALTAGDLKALDALADPDLIYIDADGRLMTKTEVLSYARSAHPERLIKDLTKVQAFDDIVVVNGTYQSKEMENGRVLTRKGQFTDTWRYRNSNWACIAAQSTPEIGTAK